MHIFHAKLIHFLPFYKMQNAAHKRTRLKSIVWIQTVVFGHLHVNRSFFHSFLLQILAEAPKTLQTVEKLSREQIVHPEVLLLEREDSKCCGDAASPYL